MRELSQWHESAHESRKPAGELFGRDHQFRGRVLASLLPIGRRGFAPHEAHQRRLQQGVLWEAWRLSKAQVGISKCDCEGPPPPSQICFPPGSLPWSCPIKHRCGILMDASCTMDFQNFGAAHGLGAASLYACGGVSICRGVYWSLIAICVEKHR